MFDPMLKRLATLLGGSNDSSIKQMEPIVDEINEMESEFERFSDDELRAKTEEFKQLISDGEELDDLLPEAFAIVREASKRALGQRHFDVQLMTGMALHQGKIAEMKTGEGKTLGATLPCYLNALAGRGVHVVTVNDYLARRDAQWMGAIFNLLGVTVGTLQHDAAYMYDVDADSGDPSMERLRKVERREAYLADITYGTNNEFGFDYLRDNMVVELGQRVQRGLHYAIVDEVDNILIDEARTPLIISGPAEQSPKEYNTFARLVPNLDPEQDYAIDEKHNSVSLTTDGISKLEKMLGVKNLYDSSNYGLVHFVENALKANTIYQRDQEYVVRDGEVIIVDEFTGRLMAGRRYSDGIHQAIEAKEGVQIQRETITYAAITLQNYFRLYEKLSGMTGTAATEGEEFWKIYKLDVLEIPTNMPMVRDDQNNLVYKDQEAKHRAVIAEVQERHGRGQPVLLGTTDIDKSEVISEQLKRIGIPHEVLNAKQHEREATIVAQAGRPGAVTVATNMAGRGTDIVLGGNPDDSMTEGEWQEMHDKVVELGGLHIIGTEGHEARRIENQLRGRAGRQGDPGSSRFYVALDDDLMRRFGGERIKTIMSWAGLDEDTAIENRMVSKSIESAQVKVEAYHFDIRKHLVDYDDVINTHRDVIYGEREKILTGADLKSNIQAMVEQEVQEVLDQYMADRSPENWDTEAVLREVNNMFPPPDDLLDPDELALMAKEEIEERLIARALEVYEAREEELTPDVMRQIERQLMLRVVDHNWVQHLTSMENLRQGIGLHAYGQRDPLVMYKKEGHEMFQSLQERIRSDVVHTIYHLGVTQGGNGRSRGSKATSRNGEASIMTRVTGKRSRETVTAGGRKVGRNDACPCGSGKKYKRCHGA
jgi:preprotein translocase subunit SecA